MIKPLHFQKAKTSHNIQLAKITSIVNIKVSLIKVLIFEGKCNLIWAFLMAQMVENPPVNAGHEGLIPGLGRSPGEGNGHPLQYSCLENSMDRRDWQDTVHGVAKSWTQLSD